MAKDRLNPCVFYVCAHEACEKGFVDVTMAKCKNCQKYRARKNKRKQESIRAKRQKDKDRHECW